MSKKYRPSNGSEGECFMCQFCYSCLNEKWHHTGNDDDKKCEIISLSMCFDLSDPEYPEEWTYDVLGHPTCTAHIPHEWNIGNDGEDDNDDFWTPPKKPPPMPDNQLCFPFVLDGILEDHKVPELNIQHNG